MQLTIIAVCYSDDEPDNDILHFTRYNLHDHDKYKDNVIRKAEIDESSIDASKRTIIIVTNVMGLDDKANYERLIKNYLDFSAVNLIVVTRNLNTTIKYKLTIHAFVNLIHDYLTTLSKRQSGDYLDFHLIGYSSGTDIAGLIGAKIFEKTGRKLPRITALNPIQDQYPTDESFLTEVCADFVDVTHTNVKNIKTVKKMGHVDFYPNGGLRQINCTQDNDGINHLKRLQIIYLIILFNFVEFKQDLRDQMKSIEYFTNSISTDNLKGVKCTSWDDFKNGKCEENDFTFYGEKVDKKARGNYFFFLPTTNTAKS